MVSTNSNLKHRIMAIRFAIWDLHLYLDTHCDDHTAKELSEKYIKQYQGLICEYENKYGCLTSDNCHGENWMQKPFPWDNSGGDC